MSIVKKDSAIVSVRAGAFGGEAALAETTSENIVVKRIDDLVVEPRFMGCVCSFERPVVEPVLYVDAVTAGLWIADVMAKYPSGVFDGLINWNPFTEGPPYRKIASEGAGPFSNVSLTLHNRTDRPGRITMRIVAKLA